MTSATHDVDVTREDGFWVGVVRGVRGGATEARRLSALADEVRDLLGGLLDVPGEDLDLELHLPDRAAEMPDLETERQSPRP